MDTTEHADKHTPAPWLIAHEIAGEGIWIESSGDEPDEICLVSNATVSADVILANASLIAAAPELLAALKAIVTHGEPIYPEDWVRMKAAGLSAIAKAEGRTEA